MIRSFSELQKPLLPKQEILETMYSDKASTISLSDMMSSLEKDQKYYNAASELTISEILNFKRKK